MSAVGTTLLQSPGWNEGKARYATLGKHKQKRIELRRSGTTEHSFGLCHCWVAVGGVPLLKELKGCRKRLTQGLRAGLCRSIALTGLFADEPNSSICRKLSDLLERCRCLHLLLDLLSGAGVSAVGTTPLHSPGWNEGKARYETLGKHKQKRIELRRSGTYPRTQMLQRINTTQQTYYGLCRPFGAQ